MHSAYASPAPSYWPYYSAAQPSLKMRNRRLRRAARRWPTLINSDKLTRR